MTGSTPWLFRRRDVAEQVAGQVSAGIGPVVTVEAPRRAGKTTFARSDLVPALEATGRPVVYAALWTQNPHKALVSAMDARDPGPPTTATLSLFGLRVTATVPQAPPKEDGDDVADALSRLAAQRGILVLDDLSTVPGDPNGPELMMLLRAALDRRDGLNAVALSPPDEMSEILGDPTAPWFRFAMRSTLPPLDDAFVAHQIAVFEDVFRRAVDRQLAEEVFETSGRLPGPLQAWLQQIGLDPTIDPSEALAIVEANEIALMGLERSWLSLGPDHRLVARLIAEGERKIYGKAARARMEALAGRSLSPSKVQGAVRTLANRGVVRLASNGASIATPLAARWIAARPEDEL